MKQRTLAQNRALHKWCDMLSIELNNAGLSVMETLKHDAEIPWTPERVKELMVKPIIELAYRKDSTTKLTTKELSQTAEIIMRHLGEKHGLTCTFPSIETLLDEKRSNE